MSELSNILNDLKNISLFENELTNFQFIPSVKYKDKLQEISKTLLNVGISFVCPTIVLKGGRSAYYLCNNPKLSALYSSTGLGRTDNYFEMAIKESFIFYPQNSYKNYDKVQLTVIDILQEKFDMYNTYALVRDSEDFYLVVGVGHNRLVLDTKKTYEKTHKEVETFLVRFFDEMSYAYIEQFPALKYSRFFRDRSYRNKLIKKENGKDFFNSFSLISERENECLYWVSKGKNAKEIGHIMKISPHTVNEHKKSILKKLNTANMTHAVHLWTKHYW